MATKKKTSFTLNPKDKKLLELLSKKEARSQTKEIEFLIRQRAEQLKIKEP
jgi:ribosomal protein L27